ncbi:RNA polymerase subunit sigma-24 [Brachybacterium endophyticum]|uniref:RNA polymerase subunit sigma-24 n=1 Tax=Brachybacterium endophyticum TaxID=2182385 RepID=A0A2U2RHV0_9MICO|nr:DUF6596 domain-containing protein [Brachybacterium endophyticum]PWH05452.1 RNA polymerase subunit sigma-24 [Brachybacterium endophyticum]
MDEHHLRELVPATIAIVRRRGADFAEAEDAVQEALLQAVTTWAHDPPRDPLGWLVTTSWRRHLDQLRAEDARRRREERAAPHDPVSATGWGERSDVTVPTTDDTLDLFFLCAHPALSPSAATALTLRAVGGLTTAQIARAHLVPEATMAQRITRAKRSPAGRRLDAPGDIATVLRVLYLIFNEGYGGDLDLSAEAIRLARQLNLAIDHPEVAGLLALMLLHHARRPARFTTGGALVPLAQQDRALWDGTAIREAVGILQGALARDALGPYQVQAAIAALHADAPSASQTDWVQILEWYDELMLLAPSPVVALNRVVALGEADGPRAALLELDTIPSSVPRRTATEAHLRERTGELETAAGLYAQAAREADTVPERDHLMRQAARLRTHLGQERGGDGPVL